MLQKKHENDKEILVLEELCKQFENNYEKDELIFEIKYFNDKNDCDDENEKI